LCNQRKRGSKTDMAVTFARDTPSMRVMKRRRIILT
jgi:hypothetical protein